MTDAKLWTCLGILNTNEIWEITNIYNTLEMATLTAKSFIHALIKANDFSEEEQMYIGQLKDNIVSRAQHLNSQTSMFSTIEV